MVPCRDQVTIQRPRSVRQQAIIYPQPHTGDAMNWQPDITTTSEIAGRKPIVQGTRLKATHLVTCFDERICN